MNDKYEDDAAWFDYMSGKYAWPYFQTLVNLVRRNPQAAAWTILLHLAD